ncbi:LacI family DNA-binding transcriptional regulator [Pseudomonas knackmussii]|uniref:LacI family DNA-binding transcriptional regulator n=1 Tax=Pseudomonas knackmussii TaxID=65741 RepID=UPI003F4A62A8
MVSMKDVARAAGVSQPAVSYAYSGSPKVSAAQREHIFAVAQELGYPGPNLRARSLRSGRIGAIGLVVMDQLSYACDDPWATSLLRGISSINELSNVALTLFPMNSRRLEDDAEGGDVHMAVRGLVDGLIISTLPDDHPTVQYVLKRKMPFVLVDSPRIEGAHYVGIDDRKAAREQMRHLLGLGHRKIGVLLERLRPDGHRGMVDRRRFDRSTEMIVRERLAGYLEEAAEAGLGFDDLQIVEAGGFDSAIGQAAAMALLRKQEVTAVVASSDVMALSCMAAAHELDLSVPRDISIIGFDDIPEAASKGLTTIRQPLLEKGQCAARFLTEILKSPPGPEEPPKVKIYPTRLIVRATTSTPKFEL